MSQVWLISGPPGCGKTNWILDIFRNHKGSCGYLRLKGYGELDLIQVAESKIDFTFLKDQIPQLIDFSVVDNSSLFNQKELLICIELPQFRKPDIYGIAGIDSRVLNQLEALNLNPNKYLHFGRDKELPIKDTLDFKKIESYSLNLYKFVWDPASLNTFWFELVNGAYGDVYRSKALMNLPDGRSILFNWILTQEASQYFHLNKISPLNGRSESYSEIVIQGININFKVIQATINQCILNNSVLEYHQSSLREAQLQPSS